LIELFYIMMLGEWRPNNAPSGEEIRKGFTNPEYLGSSAGVPACLPVLEIEPR
jgi:hypothetical protein